MSYREVNCPELSQSNLKRYFNIGILFRYKLQVVKSMLKNVFVMRINKISYGSYGKLYKSEQPGTYSKCCIPITCEREQKPSCHDSEHLTSDSTIQHPKLCISSARVPLVKLNETTIRRCPLSPRLQNSWLIYLVFFGAVCRCFVSSSLPQPALSMCKQETQYLTKEKNADMGH